MTQRPEKRRISTDYFVPVVGNAAIAGQVAEGVNIPLVILDTSERPDVAEMIRVQAFVPPGDAVSTWAGVEGRPDDIVLMLDFERPVQTKVMLSFSIETQGILIEAALTAKAIYLQAGRPGDRLIHDPDRPKMLVELPDGGFRAKWDELFLERMTSVFARQLGVPRRKARPHARELINSLHTFTEFRMPQV